jgi:toxin CptA
MHWPPPVRVVLSPSYTALALIGALAVATCAVIATLPLEPAALGLATIVVVVWAVDRIHVVALRHGPRAVRQFQVRGDLTVVIVTGDGNACAGRIHRDSYVGARLSTLVWRPFGRWRLRAILLLPDMLPAQDFRRLRVLLRYGRSDVAHGDPTSHA